jgi:amiloride-sensitive sodium channel
VKSIGELNDETVITFEDPVYHPLTEIYFPAVTLCNVNQVRRSYFEELGIYENETAINHVSSFYMGDRIEQDPAYHNVSNEVIDALQESVKTNVGLKRTAHQACEDMLLGYEWMGKKYYKDDYSIEYETDWGMCCMFHPKLRYSPHPKFNLEKQGHKEYQIEWNTWKENVTKGVKVGRELGYILLLDVESFDYNGAEVSYEGFQMVVGSYHEQAIVNQRAIQIAPGTVNQIAITPSLTSITERALSRFEPKKRHCYGEKEIAMSYFKASKGYMYTLDNCIFESTLNKVYELCECYPSSLNFYNNTACTGLMRKCMDDVYENLTMVTNIKHDNEVKECFPLCKEQFISLFMTSSSYPNENLFIYRREFCIMAEKLVEKCNGTRKKSLEEMYPEICSKLDAVKNINLNEACVNRHWPLTRSKLPNCTWEKCEVEEAVIRYSRDNLVAINIFFPNPFAKRNIRDVKFTNLGFIGNVGGLLGLCMGFSLISVAEILFHLLATFLSFCIPPKTKAKMINGAKY